MRIRSPLPAETLLDTSLTQSVGGDHVWTASYFEFCFVAKLSTSSINESIVFNLSRLDCRVVMRPYSAAT